MDIEVARGIQLLASLAILIFLRDRIVHERRFGLSVLFVGATFLMPLLAALFTELGTRDGAETVEVLGGFAVLLQGVSLLFLLFAFLPYPWDLPDPSTGRRGRGKKTPAKKAGRSSGA